MRLVRPTRSNSLRPSRLIRSMWPTRLLLHLIALGHIFSVAVIFNGATFTCACTVVLLLLLLFRSKEKVRLSNLILCSPVSVQQQHCPLRPHKIFCSLRLFAKDKGYFGVSDSWFECRCSWGVIDKGSNNCCNLKDSVDEIILDKNWFDNQPKGTFRNLAFSLRIWDYQFGNQPEVFVGFS